MRRHKQRLSARASGYGTAREVDIPLPIAGMFTEANTAEVSGIYAGDLVNWRSTGASLQLRSQSSLELGRTFLQRIPYEFGTVQKFIGIGTFRISIGEHFILRESSSLYTAGYISGYAVLVDGAGPPMIANTTSVQNASFTTSTGKSPDTFDGMVAHQDRLFFWQTLDELDFYYGDVGAITGTLTRFPMGRLGNITGAMLTCKSLTIDAGSGMNDVLAIFTTTGQIVAYEGNDPGDAGAWRQSSRIRVSPAISAEAFVQVGADLWMLTAAGVVSVLDTLRQSSLALVNTVSRPVQQQLVDQIAEGGDWSMHLSADGLRVIINRVFEGVASQLIYWTDTKAWTVADYPAKAWHNLGVKTHFTALTGELGTIGTGNEQITGRWVSSWFRLPKNSGITYLRPTIIARGAMDVRITLLSNHDDTPDDIAESEQTVHIEPDNPPGLNGRVALNDVIAVDAVGASFQIIMEITAEWAEIVSLQAGVQ